MTYIDNFINKINDKNDTVFISPINNSMINKIIDSKLLKDYYSTISYDDQEVLRNFISATSRPTSSSDTMTKNLSLLNYGYHETFYIYRKRRIVCLFRIK